MSANQSILRILLLDLYLEHFVPLVAQINVSQVCLIIFFLLNWVLRSKVRIALRVERMGRFAELVRLSLLKLSDVIVVRLSQPATILLLNVNAEATSSMISYPQIGRFLVYLTCNVLPKSLLSWVQSRSNKISFNFHGFISRNFSVRKRFIKFATLQTCFEFVLVWCSYSHILKCGRVGFTMGWLHVERLVFIWVVWIASIILFLRYLLRLVI